MDHVAGTIRDFVRKHGQVASTDGLFDDDIDLFDYGYLDSFGIVGLIEMIDQCFSVDLSDLDFYAEGVRTIRGIARIVDARIVS